MTLDLTFLTPLEINPVNPELFMKALTHKSDFSRSGADFNNEKLEFLGDAVLDLVLADILMEKFPEDDEGQLSRKKAALVREETLCRKALDIGLDNHLILGTNEAAQGMNKNQRLLASALEAVVGAIYKDSGYEKTYAWLDKQFQTNLLEIQEDPDFLTDHKTKLQELIQAESKKTPAYTVVSSEGPDHNRLFQVEVHVDGEPLAQGTGSSKKAAAQDAAKKALEGIQ